LARHAQELARHRNRNGRPTITWLRRSTSASYYAVFHAVALEVTRQIAPGTPDDVRYHLARSIQHGRVADVLNWVEKGEKGRRLSAPVVKHLHDNADIVRLATLFSVLREARHDADYNHLATIGLAATLAHHRQAEEALDLVTRLSGTADGVALFALIALHTSLA
jgi:hypothetical protein